jgi:hypothetical protein
MELESRYRAKNRFQEPSLEMYFFLTVYLSKQGNDVYTKQIMGLIFTNENAKVLLDSD